MTRRRRAAVLLGLALALGALAASEVRGREQALQRALSPRVQVVVAQRDLRAGRRIELDALAVRDVPLRYAPDGAYAAPAEVVGRRAAVDIPRGTDLAVALVEASDGVASPLAQLRPGERVAPLVAIGDPAAIVAGTRVDVLITRSDTAGEGATRLALEDAEVLAARAAPAAEADAALPRVALQLRVTQRQAVLLAAAQDFASAVRVLARAPGDRRRTRDGLEVDAGL